MPNHVTNRITIPEPGLLAPLIGEEGDRKTFDFGALIPMPECISKEGTSLRIQSAAEIALGLIDFSDQAKMPKDPLANIRAATGVLHRANCTRQLLQGPMPKDFSDADFEAWLGMLRAWKETGFLEWYGWCVANWGTKWNAYSVEVVSPTILKFDTAWSPPHPVIQRLAERTGKGLRHEWADENTGHNVGFSVYGDAGNLIEQQELSESKRGYELAFELCGGDENYRWDGKQYVWAEEGD